MRKGKLLPGGHEVSDQTREFRSVIGIWSLLGLMMAVTDYFTGELTGSMSAVARLVGAAVLFTVVGAGTYPVARAIARHHPFAKPQLIATLAVNLGAGLCLASLLAVALGAIESGLWWRFAAPESGEVLAHLFVSNLPRGMMAFVVNVLTAYSFDYHRQFRENALKACSLESQLARAQLQALRSQLQPHFLFNVLHAIVALVRKDDRDGAIGAVTGLSNLLRATLSSVDEQEVSLAEEMRVVQLYLQLQQILLKGRLAVVMDLDPEVMDVVVPSFILQPLVENAIHHGVKGQPGGGKIEIRGGVVEKMLKLEVLDDGPGVQHTLEELEQTGIGLAATHKRLRTLYGNTYTFSLCNGPAAGAVATVIIPLCAKRHETAELTLV
jgi:two-component system LytT family sensor kinase